MSSDSKSSKLIMAGTSIGNTEDIPKRSLAHLRDSDMLIFEEDRPARSFLKEAGVHREYYKYSEHKNEHTLDEFKNSIKDKQTICYMSDQGMPVLADPGKDLLNIAYQSNCKIQVIPGPSSVTAAISACPFVDNSFYFKGFLPREAKSRQQAIQKLTTLNDPFIVLDAPYRLNALINDFREIIPKRRCLLAVDISGPNENYYLSNFSRLGNTIKDLPKKTNFVLIIKGTS